MARLPVGGNPGRCSTFSSSWALVSALLCVPLAYDGAMPFRGRLSVPSSGAAQRLPPYAHSRDKVALGTAFVRLVGVGAIDPRVRSNENPLPAKSRDEPRPP